MTVKKEYYHSGLMWFEHTYQEGKFHGVLKGWYENGQQAYEESFQEGKRHGVSKYWTESGELGRALYYLYGNSVTEEEYKKHQLIEKLSGL